MALLLVEAQRPLDAQLPTLAVRGSTAVRDTTLTSESSLLYLLDVHYVSTNIDNGRVRKDVVQTNNKGDYSVTVWPGSLDIHIVRKVDAESKGGFDVWLVGSLEGFKVAPNATLALPTIQLDKRTLPATSLKRMEPWLSVPTLQLVRFTIPRGDPKNIDGQIGPDRRADHASSIEASVVDPNGRRIRRASVHAISSTTGEEAESAVVRSGQGFEFNAPTDGVIFIHVQAPGFHSRTLLLSKRLGSAELYDEQSHSVSRPIRIQLQRLKSQFDSHPENTPFSIDSSRGISFDTEVITGLPLPLFRNPDVLLELAPGFAQPPQTFSTVGPSLAPGIGTAGSFAINGVRARDNNFTVDGSDYNDEEFGVRRQGFITPFPQSIDSIGYYQAVTANGDARYGRSLGADINVLSQSGGPKLHLSAYALGTGGVLNAKDYFDTNLRQYPVEYQRFVPVTGDGSLAGQQVQFMLSPGYQGLITVRNNLGFQANPLQESITTSRVSYGAAGGGPLGFRKTYWYASFERELQDGNTEQSFAVPTVRQRGVFGNGDTGGTPYPCSTSELGTFVYDLYSVNGCIGAGLQLSPFFPATLSGDGILSLIPFPNNPLGPYGTNTYTAVLPNSAHGYVVSGRIDKETTLLGRANNLTLRVNDTDDSTDLPSIGGAIFSSLKVKTRTTNIATYFTTAFSPHFFNTFRFSYGDSSAGFTPLGSPLLPSDAIKSGPEAGWLLNAPLLLNITSPLGGAPGIPTYASPSATTLFSYPGAPSVTDDSESSTGPIGEVNILGYSPVGADTYHVPQTRNDHTVQVADTLSITSGRSISYVGIDTRSVNLDSYEDRNARTYAEFHGSPLFPSNLGLAALGLPTGIYQTLGFNPESSVTFGQRQVEIFAQEYFHARPNLTLSGGLRLDLGILPNANSRLKSAFDPTTFANQLAEATDQCGAYDVRCTIAAGEIGAAFNGDFAQVFGSGFQGVTPRAGLAWDTMGNGRAVVRAGWGMYKSAFPSAVIDETRSAFDEFLPVNTAGYEYENPNVYSYLPNPAFGNPSVTYGIYAQPGTLNLLAPNTNPVSLFAFSPNGLCPVLVTRLRQPYTMQFNSTVEVGIGKSSTINIAYVGSLGRRLIVTSTPGGGPGALLNYFCYGCQANMPASGFPLYGVEQFIPSSVYEKQFQSSASSSYNSLQLSFQRRLANGVQGGLSFTYSHTLDFSSDFFDTAGEYALPGNSQSPAERGNSAYDVRLRTSGWFLWQLPSILHDKFTADWRLTGIVTQQSGQPYTVNTAVDLNQDGNATDRPLSLSGLKRTGRRRTQLLITQPLSQWAYPSSVPDPVSGVQVESPVGRNTFHSSGTSEVNLGLARDLGLPRETRLTIRCDVFNVFNHPSFGIPVRILEAPAFGTSVSTVVPARSIQLGLNVSF